MAVRGITGFLALVAVVALAGGSGQAAPTRTTSHSCIVLTPPAADFQAELLEVTQAVQDPANSVRLVAGKRTFVRFFARVVAPRGGCTTTARLLIRRGLSSRTLVPLNPGGTVLVPPGRPTRFSRSTSSSAFLFELPTAFTSGTVHLVGRVNPDPADPPETMRGNNQIAETVTFEEVPVPRLVIHEVRYTFADGLIGHSPDSRATLGVLSWLRRAFPVPDIHLVSMAYSWGAGSNRFSDGALRLTSPNCDSLNTRLLVSYFPDIGFATLFSEALGRHFRLRRYIGLVADTGGFMRGCSLGIPGVVASGPTGTTRTSGWDFDGNYADWYTAHELAHTFGRYHAEFCDAGGGRSYPYPRGAISPFEDDASALVGFDVQTQAVYPFNVWKDVMTYCAFQWVSDFTYEAIMRFLEAAPAARIAGADPIPAPQQPLLAVVGSIDPEEKEARFEPVFEVRAPAASPSSQGPYAIVLRDGDEKVLARHRFEPIAEESGRPLDPEEPEFRRLIVAQLVPWVPGVARIELWGRGGRLASLEAGAAPPAVSIVSPNGGDLWGDPITLKWQAADPDGDALTYTVQYSGDGGSTWRSVGLPTTETQLEIPRRNVSASPDAYFRVLASDGLHTGSDVTDAPAVVPDVPPTVEIVSPAANDAVAADATLALDANAYDVDVGSLHGKDVSWYSNRDGLLGDGPRLSVTGLSPGSHTITVIAGGGQQPATDTVDVSVVADPRQLPQPPDELLVGPQPVVVSPKKGGEATVLVSDRNGRGIRWYAEPSEPWLVLGAASGRTPDELLVSVRRKTEPGQRAEIVFTSPDLPNAAVSIPVVVEH